MRWKYHWLHIPSGKTGEQISLPMTRREFIERLNGWNASPEWKYWNDPNDAPLEDEDEDPEANWESFYNGNINKGN